MKKYLPVIFLAGCLQIVFSQPATAWKYLPQGHNAVGFTTMRVTGSKGDSLSVGTWYPSGTGTSGERMSLKDYIIAGKQTPGMADTAPLNDFKHVLELPFLYHLQPVTSAEFADAVSIPLSAYKNAPVKKGRFPLVITFCAPGSYPETFEYLASHGFVVACVSAHLGQPPNDTLLYVHATDVLGELIDIMTKQPNVDTAAIAAFGHGWGIQAPFYLAMRTHRLKLLINLDGGVFGPRSKTTLSPDYNPAKLQIPMLHIVTQGTAGEDDEKQFKALSNQRYKVLIKDTAVWHHDFTVYGRVVDNGLHQRGAASPLVQEAYTAVHKLVLYFLKHGRLDATAVPANLFNYIAPDK